MAEYDRLFSCARDLKIFSSLKSERQQFKIRNMNNYELGLFALYLSKHLEIVALKTPNLTLPSKLSTRRVFSTTANLLESIIGGLANKYISKEIARQEIIKATSMVLQVESHLKVKAREMKRNQIADLRVNSAQFKAIDISELDKYVRDFNRVTDMMQPIMKKYGATGNMPALTVNPKTPVEPKPDDTGDFYASPSNYQGYLQKFTQSHHDAFLQASKQIKLPTNIGTQPGQTLWAITLLPIYVQSNPPLRANELQRAGIKFSELDKNSIIIYKQHVLVVYTKQPLHEYEDTVNRAKAAIRAQFNIDYLYSKPFMSKEVGKPYAFYWLVAVSSHLSPFKITGIGLPYSPELKKLEDLTNNTQQIKHEADAEGIAQRERVQRNVELAKPLFEQYNSIQAQLDDIKKNTKRNRDELKALKETSNSQKLQLAQLRPNSDDYRKKQANTIALDSRIGIIEDTIKNESKIRMMGLQQKLDKLQADIKEFSKANARM